MTTSQLPSIAPIRADRAETFLPHLNHFMPMYEITGRLRESAFISQVLHESGDLRYTEEIASGVGYEGRRDLGNIYKGDGVKYKGRGLIQITGRFNYRACGKALGQDFESSPLLLEEPLYAVQSACWFWKMKGLNEIADKSDTWRVRVRKGKPNEAVYDKFQYITYRINGGLTHYNERLQRYKQALKVLV